MAVSQPVKKQAVVVHSVTLGMSCLKSARSIVKAEMPRGGDDVDGRVRFGAGLACG